MSITTPQQDFQAGAILTAAQLDTYLSANMKGILDSYFGGGGVATRFVAPGEFAVSRGSAARGFVGSGGNELRADAWAFDPTTDEAISCQIYVPWSPAAGTITAKIYWAPASTNTGNVAWQVMVSDVESAEQIDQAVDETENATQAGSGTAENLHITAAVTINRTGRFWWVTIYRNADDAGDTFTGDAWFLGLLLEFTPT